METNAILHKPIWCFHFTNNSTKFIANNTAFRQCTGTITNNQVIDKMHVNFLYLFKPSISLIKEALWSSSLNTIQLNPAMTYFTPLAVSVT